MSAPLDIPGVIIKPYVRMTQRGKWVKPEAQAYLTSKAALSLQIKTAMNAAGKEMLPGQTPLKVVIRLYAPSNPGHRCDLDNQIKAILDACNGVAFADDRWVDEIDAERHIGEDPRLVLNIMQLDFRVVEA